MHLSKKVTTKNTKNKQKDQIQLQIAFEEAIKGYKLF